MSEWISVKERLPDNAFDVIVCDKSGFRRIAWWNDCKNEWRPEGEGSGPGSEVTHWMPLPDPPEPQP
jgi:hypothetical protein